MVGIGEKWYGQKFNRYIYIFGLLKKYTHKRSLTRGVPINSHYRLMLRYGLVPPGTSSKHREPFLALNHLCHVKIAKHTHRLVSLIGFK